MRVTASMTGVKGTARKLEAHGLRVARRVADGNEAAYRDVLFPASQEYVPEDTGRLKASGYVETEGSGWHRYTEVGYGHEDFPAGRFWSQKQQRYVFRYPYSYAHIVHFNPLNVAFAKGEQFFLLKPLLELRDEMRRALRDRLGVP